MTHDTNGTRRGSPTEGITTQRAEWSARREVAAWKAHKRRQHTDDPEIHCEAVCTWLDHVGGSRARIKVRHPDGRVAQIEVPFGPASAREGVTVAWWDTRDGSAEIKALERFKRDYSSAENLERLSRRATWILFWDRSAPFLAPAITASFAMLVGLALGIGVGWSSIVAVAAALLTTIVALVVIRGGKL